MNIYAGIGSRETPADILKRMEDYGARAALKNWVLRSGGANGADSAFEAGCDSQNGAKEIFLPWKRYNGNTSPLFYVSREAMEIAEQYHPAWHRCSQGARKLHGRNVHIMLGESLDAPVDLVICWTPDGLITGGTGQALRMAQGLGIKVVNLGLPEVEAKASVA